MAGVGVAPRGTAAKKSGARVPLNSDQEHFAELVAAQTGLSLRVVQAWVLAEQPASTSPTAQGHNWLNLSAASAGVIGTNPLDGYPRFSSTAAAAHATSQNILTNGAYANIRAARGKSDWAQMVAIAQSAWAGGHYGASGSNAAGNLITTYQEMPGSGTTLGTGAGAAGAAGAHNAAAGNQINAGAATKTTPGLFDCSGSDSYFFGLVSTPSSGDIGCYLLGTLKLIGMVVIGSAAAVAGFYLILPRGGKSALQAGAMVVAPEAAAGKIAAGAAFADKRQARFNGSSQSGPSPISEETARRMRADTALKNAKARHLNVKSKALKAETPSAAHGGFSANETAKYSRAMKAPKGPRPDRMAV